MKERSCRTCRFQKAKLLDIEKDEDGNETPVFERYCTVDGKNTRLRITEFACGLWKELTI